MVHIKPRLIFHLTHRGRLLRKTKICLYWYLASGSLGSLIPTLAAYFIALLNHRKVWVGRNLEGHLVPTPYHGQGHHLLELPMAPSNLALDTTKDGAYLSHTTALLKVFHKSISIHIATEQQQQHVGSTPHPRKVNLLPMRLMSPPWTTSTQHKRFTQGFSTGPDASKFFLSELLNLFDRSPISQTRSGTQRGANAIINSVMSPTEMQFLGQVFRDHTFSSCRLSSNQKKKLRVCYFISFFPPQRTRRQYPGKARPPQPLQAMRVHLFPRC